MEKMEKIELRSINYYSGLGYAICCRLIDEFLATQPAHQNFFLIFTTRSQAKSNDTAQRLQNYVDNVREKRSTAWYKRRFASSLFERAETDSDDLRERITKGDAGLSVKKDFRSFKLGAAIKLASSRITLCPEHVELTCVASVLELSSRLRTSLPRLDVLICNAGTGGVIGIDWLKAARRVPFDFVKELTCPSYKIAAVGWLAEAQRRLKGYGKGNGVNEKETSNAGGDEKVDSANGGSKEREEKDPPLGMVFASNVLGHYVLGHEIAPLMSRKEWITMTGMKEREDDQRRTFLCKGSSSKRDYTYTINSEHKSGLIDHTYKHSNIPNDHDPDSSGSHGRPNAIQTSGGPDPNPSPEFRRHHFRNPNNSRIIWISSLEAYDHSLHFEGGKDNNPIQANAKTTTSSRNSDDIQGLTHPLAYESSKRLTDILVLTSEMDSVKRSWVRKYFSYDKDKDTTINKPNSIDNENANNNYLDTTTAELSSAPASPSINLLPPRLYLAHPGICATSIVTLPFYLLELLMALSLYIARWIGSPWHTADAYTGAGAPVKVALAAWDHNDEYSENTIKWGSGTDRWGRLMIRKTRIEGWTGGDGGDSKDTNNGNLSSTTGRKATSMSDKSLPSSLSTLSSQFEDLGWHCWREMEQLRVEWMERIRKPK